MKRVDDVSFRRIESRMRNVLNDVVAPTIGTDDPAYVAMIVEQALVGIMNVVEDET